mmetsp:Transcript_4541/g.6811  ORF Transcript_4541/g.6811 Transcript_4541/m.6811 type:complete len:208 (+) Transcript_4541:216-839(+)
MAAGPPLILSATNGTSSKEGGKKKKQSSSAKVAPAASSNQERYALAVSFVVTALLKAYDDGSALNFTKLKSQAARRYKLQGIPRVSDILSAIPQTHRDGLLPFLRQKPVRTASGVAVVAVMSKPHRCPHIAMTGNVCVYCPGGPDSDFEYSTQAYTGYEPTSMRAIRARYDPYSQTRGRVAQLRALGHSVDKVVSVFLTVSLSYPRI